MYHVLLEGETGAAMLGSGSITLHLFENLADVEGLKIEDAAVEYRGLGWRCCEY